MHMAKQQPAHEIRFGSIRATIWKNSTANGSMFNVTVNWLYKDGDEWKRSDSFSRDDLLVLAKVADLAHTWIFEQAVTERSRQS
jgi:hypothetical protein